MYLFIYNNANYYKITSKKYKNYKITSNMQIKTMDKNPGPNLCITKITTLYIKISIIYLLSFQ